MQKIAFAILSTILITAHLARAQESKRKDSPAPEPEKINWHTDYNAARKEAEKLKRPLFLYVPMSVNYYCEKFEKETLANGKVTVLLNERFVPLKINYSDEGTRDLLQHLQVYRFPTTITADPDGRIRHTKIGFFSVDTMMEVLESTLNPPAAPDKKETPSANEKGN
jgi:thioredoxin-related protein